MSLKPSKKKKILENFEVELKNFKQICPIEMLDKLDNPISLRSHNESRLMSKIKVFASALAKWQKVLLIKIINEKKILIWYYL